MPKKKTSSQRKLLKKESSLPILFILAVIGIIILFVNIPESKKYQYTPTQLETAVNSATLQIPDTGFTVTLDAGHADFSDDEIQGNVTMTKPYFSVETTEGYDTFTAMHYNLGGSGEYGAVALFHSIENSTVFANSYILGDRVKIEKIDKISGDKNVYEIEIDYLDRDENTPMAADPTVKKSITLKIDNHKIVTTPQE